MKADRLSVTITIDSNDPYIDLKKSLMPIQQPKKQPDQQPDPNIERSFFLSDHISPYEDIDSGLLPAIGFLRFKYYDGDMVNLYQYKNNRERFSYQVDLSKLKA